MKWLWLINFSSFTVSLQAAEKAEGSTLPRRKKATRTRERRRLHAPGKGRRFSHRQFHRHPTYNCSRRSHEVREIWPFIVARKRWQEVSKKSPSPCAQPHHALDIGKHRSQCQINCVPLEVVIGAMHAGVHINSIAIRIFCRWVVHSYTTPQHSTTSKVPIVSTTFYRLVSVNTLLGA